jgi:DNA-binding response OmpR family regulator
MSRGAVIYVVEDEPDLAEAYADYLTELGYRVRLAGSGAAFDRLIADQGPPHLLILDMNLPGERGHEILSRVVAGKDYPILIATAINETMDRVIAIEHGADDYIVKPTALRELAARVGGLLARYGRRERRLARFETVLVDLTSQKLLRDGAGIESLGPGEIALIRAFVENPERVLSREDLISLAPAEDAGVLDRAIDNRVSRLRRKLCTRMIETERGRGYVYMPGKPSRAGG